MGRVILFLLMCLSLQAQTITVDGNTYKIMGDEMMSDPNTYLHQFIEDANARGYNIDPNIRGVFEFTVPSGNTKGWSVRSDACRGSYRIALQRHYWNNYDARAGFVTGSSNLYEQRRHLAYHELGHALLRLNHICHGNTVQLGDRLHLNVNRDIMLSVRECDIASRTNPNGIVDSYAYSHYPFRWDWHLDRMFNPGYQSTYTCGSGKSTTPILDY